MIKYLLTQWLLSLTALKPFALLELIGRSLIRYAQSMGMFILYFGWLFVIDLCLMLAAGRGIMKELYEALAKNGSPGAGISTLFVLSSVLWFIVSALFFIIMSKKDPLESPLSYLRGQIMRYFHLALLIAAVKFFAIGILVSMGIRYFPNVHPLIEVLITLAESLLFFGWLTAQHVTLGGITRIFEKVINVFFYNLPFVLLVASALWLTNVGLVALLFPEHGTWYQMIHPTSLLVLEKSHPLSLYRFLVFRAADLFGKFFWLCFIYQWYQTKKDVHYATLYFHR